MTTKTDWDTLAEVCYEKAKKIYGQTLPQRITERLDMELKYISDRGNARAFLLAGEVMSSDIFQRENRFNIGFQGPLGSSFVAYLCKLTTMNPLECFGNMEIELYPWMFYEQKDIHFYINAPQRLIDELKQKEEFSMPEELKLHDNSNLNLLDGLQHISNDIYSCRIAPRDQPPRMDPVSVREMFLSFTQNAAAQDNRSIVGRELLSMFPDLDSDVARDMIRTFRGYGKLPRSIHAMARIIGLLHSRGAWLDNEEHLFERCREEGKNHREYMMTCVEDVYEYLQSRHVPEEEAKRLTMIISKDNRALTKEDILLMRDFGCEGLFIECVSKIKHLWFRAQCMQCAIETRRLFYYWKICPHFYQNTLINVKNM